MSQTWTVYEPLGQYYKTVINIAAFVTISLFYPGLISARQGVENHDHIKLQNDLKITFKMTFKMALKWLSK